MTKLFNKIPGHYASSSESYFEVLRATFLVCPNTRPTKSDLPAHDRCQHVTERSTYLLACVFFFNLTEQPFMTKKQQILFHL